MLSWCSGCFWSTPTCRRCRRRLQLATRFATHFSEVGTITKVELVHQRAIGHLVNVDARVLLLTVGCLTTGSTWLILTLRATTVLCDRWLMRSVICSTNTKFKPLARDCTGLKCADQSHGTLLFAFASHVHSEPSTFWNEQMLCQC